jgi:hypothetical protein
VVRRTAVLVLASASSESGSIVSPVVSSSLTLSRLFGSLISSPRVSSGSFGNWSVASPVICVKPLRGTNPYACRSWL